MNTISTYLAIAILFFAGALLIAWGTRIILRNRREARKWKSHPAHRFHPTYVPPLEEKIKIALHGHRCADCGAPAAGVFVVPAEFGTVQDNFCQKHADARMGQARNSTWGRADAKAGWMPEELEITKTYEPRGAATWRKGLALITLPWLVLVIGALLVWWFGL